MKLSVISLVLVSALIFGCVPASEYNISRHQDFNRGWKFMLDDIEGAEATSFDDAAWRPVQLPHDWGIEDYEVQDSLYKGPFYKYQPGGGEVGFLREGTGWYRKTFSLPKLNEDQQVIIHFDGLQSIMQCWVNGHPAGDHSYGYSPFYFNITPYLNQEGTENTIAVRAVNPGENSRWYSGSGIYREVRISVLNPVSADIWGTTISTPMVSKDRAKLKIDVSINNYSSEERSVSYRAKISGPESSLFEIEGSEIMIPAGGSAEVSMAKEITEPSLWSPANPLLYTAHIEIEDDNNMLDSYTQNFGIRSIAYSSEHGFLLNGEPFLIKGANMHHDNGLLGAAANKDAEYRRVRIMKQNGFNAIRTAHNPPSELFLDACDELGMLVIDEAFDAWAKPKRKNDYSVHFEENWKKDLRAMIKRDKNHPSIIMWSIGNEVIERALPAGLNITSELITELKKIDTSRPVTESICNFWDNPGMTWPDAQAAFELLDVSGYNYEWSKYETDHRDYPDRVIYGSETFPMEAWENWNVALKQPYVIGGFVWTAMDYIGEASIGRSAYIPEDPDSRSQTGWPWYVAWCGDIDILGYKKPQSYYRDVVWGNSSLEMMVHARIPKGKTEFISRWGWPDELNSWTWPGAEGENLEVRVFTSYPSLVLKLNGEEVSRKNLKPEDKITAVFNVIYAPGELEVIAYDQGKEMESLSFITAGKTDHLLLEAERKIIHAAKDELVFVKVTALDEKGNWVPTDQSSMHVDVTGAGELLAAGNGSPWIQGSFRDEQFQLFQGRGQIIIRPQGSPGEISIRVSGEFIPDSETTVTVK